MPLHLTGSRAAKEAVLRQVATGKKPTVMQNADKSPRIRGRRLHQITALPCKLCQGGSFPFDRARWTILPLLATELHVMHLTPAIGLHILQVSYSRVSRPEQSLTAIAGTSPELR